jgi:hypothetical protein
VTYNGTALDKPDGQISFIGPSGELVVASIEADGTYRASNVSTGLNRVTVTYLNPKAKSENTPKPRRGEVPVSAAPPFLTPEKFGNADTSELSVKVDKDTFYNVELAGPRIP